ncbi:MAG: FAD-dependent oxidoreductase, partial [Candidatus Brocadiia bacterium]
MPESDSWRYALDADDIPEGHPTSVKLGKKLILISRTADGQIRACSGKCTHYGAPLHKGCQHDATITCPWHTARFDLTDGRMVSPPALSDLKSYPVKIDNGKVYLGEASKPEPAKATIGQDRTFLIVGAGAAGNTAAETLRREGFAGRILMVTAESDRPYDRPSLSKGYLSGEAPDKWIPLHGPDFYENWDIELLTEHKAIDLDTDRQVVSFEGEKDIGYDKLLCATGGVPRKMDIDGADAQNVFYLRTYQDARNIVRATENAERIAIIGAGFIGMEAAAALQEGGKEVHVIAPESIPLVPVFGEEIGKWLQGIHEQHGVQFHLRNTVESIRDNSGRKGLVLSTGKEITADAVLIAIGISPATDWLAGSGIAEDGVVPVNGHLESKVPDVYAAGDIARVPSPQVGNKYRVEHWAVAERQGQCAARNMVGKTEQYDEVPFFWTMQFETSVKFAGFPEDYDQVTYRGRVADGEFVAAYHTGDQLVGVSGLGRTDEILACINALKCGTNITPEDFRDG